MADSLPLYQYQALPNGRIRVLYLDPGDYDDPLRCSIHDAALDTADYVAVSYVWGSPEKVAHITVQSTEGLATLPLTASLDVLLRDVRAAMTKGTDELYSDEASIKEHHGWLYGPVTGPVEPSALWIDQISLNQNDLEEKSSQVAMMGSIYEKAACVLSYVGAKNPRHDCGMQMLHTIWDGVARSCRSAPFSVDEFPSMLPVDRWQESDWIALSELLDRDWLGRAWIVQESVLNKHGRLMCGHSVFSWELLLTVSVLFFDWPEFHRKLLVRQSQKSIRAQGRTGRVLRERLHARISSFTALVRVRDSLQKAERLSLLELLRRFRSLESSDPRDKLYSLLGLASDAEALALTLSYNRSHIDLFKDFARNTILQTLTLDVLGQANKLHQDFPSWVPDWTVPVSQISYINHDVGDYHAASGNWALNIQFHQDNILAIEGIFIDEIAKDLGIWWIAYAAEPTNGDAPAITSDTLNPIAEMCRNIGLDILNLTSDEAQRIASFLWENPSMSEVNSSSVDSTQLANQIPMSIRYRKLRKAMGTKNVLEVKSSPKEQKLVFEWLLSKDHLERGVGVVVATIGHTAYGKNICVTARKRLCTSRTQTQPGDRVAVLSGGSMCYILRPIDGTSDYRFISDSYLEGFMAGEALGDSDLASKIERISIV
ncbi:heterokaryon incompatibility protein-domain-containing protein [Lophiotrema nucula]|uniref:Heterokaryon incompatibility protein-domain-containing protein n=1 Tax=Lophiotrema nucula TaxID=690887 RepID=A0A6A5ZTH7_9PLEO|nr:heterokaryon incompatibility protein-domain-containing protein [Lophiotrema nucula]